MYTCHIHNIASITPHKNATLNEIVCLVARRQDLSIFQLGDCIVKDYTPGLWVTIQGYKAGDKLLVQNDAQQTLLTITKVTQEPAPALLIVDSMNDAGEPSDSSVVFGDTIEGASAALSYIQELKNGGDSNAVVATIHRQVFDPKTHIYHTQGDLVQQIQF